MAAVKRPKPRPLTRGLSDVELTMQKLQKVLGQSSNQVDKQEIKNVEDVLFDMFKCEETNTIPIGKFLSGLQTTGLRKQDPRLKEMMLNLQKVHQQVGMEGTSPESLRLDKDTFKSVIMDNIVLISRAFRHQFIIPDFHSFTKTIEEFYYTCKSNCGGEVASYIPQLARVNPDYFGVNLCTVDGQRFSIGDVQIPFTLQSCSKPLIYAIALNELGTETVHGYVGQEPSGRMFNELILDYNKKPHNPMINAGAIIVSSLLQSLVRPEMTMAEKFDYIMQYFKRLSGASEYVGFNNVVNISMKMEAGDKYYALGHYLKENKCFPERKAIDEFLKTRIENEKIAGGEHLGFSNSVFLSEREAADRNYALGYYMRENKCFPEKCNLRDCMDFYFQCCSMEANAEGVSVMAATLANGGICPITGDKVLAPQSVRDVLSLMHSCGMYDYSGQFAFKVGIPAKSGVSGALLVVVPNVMGICVWSPPLDSLGNSVRGVQFCQELVRVFNFHRYDNLKHAADKRDPRRHKYETKGLTIVSLLFSAASGDVTAMRRHFLRGVDMTQGDYDGRTALHLSAAEGQSDCVEFLLKQCHVPVDPRDRWGFTPLDESKRFGHTEVTKFLEAWGKVHPESFLENEDAEGELKLAPLKEET